MKYLVLLIGEGEEPRWDTLTPDQQGETMQRVRRVRGRVRAA